ncbi:MAG: hypothetical protein ACKVTZ_08285, partial [Bacteroidia bacterium]
MKTFNTPISFKLLDTANYVEMRSKATMLLWQVITVLEIIILVLCVVMFGLDAYLIPMLLFSTLVFARVIGSYLQELIEQVDNACNTSTCTFHEDKVVFHFHFNPLAAQTFWAKQMTKDLRRIDYKETYNYTDIYKVHL